MPRNINHTVYIIHLAVPYPHGQQWLVNISNGGHEIMGISSIGARGNKSSLVEYIAVDNRLKRKAQDARL